MTADQALLDAALHHADHDGPQPGWHQHAACHGAPDHIFWPGNGHTDAARTICGPCPARLACLTDGIRTERAGIPSGIRAGISQKTIRAAARPPRRRTGPQVADHTIRRAHQLTAAGHSAQHIAALLGVSERTIQRWRRTTAGPEPGKAA